MKLNASWKSWNTGGNCIVYTTDVELRDGKVGSVCVTDECVVLVPEVWTLDDFGDTEDYLFVWNYTQPEMNLVLHLAIHLKNSDRRHELLEDIATIMTEGDNK